MCDKTTSIRIFQLHFGYTTQKEQTKALVDLGTTMNFVDRVVMENNNLEMHKTSKSILCDQCG